MKVKIFVNEDEDSVSELFPRVLTEKQYQEKIDELVQDRLDNLKDDNGFIDYLANKYYSICQIFFLSEEKKAKIVKEFEPYAISSVIDEMQDCYGEYEIEI